MDNILSVWSALTAQRKGIVVLATVVVFTAVLALSRSATNPEMSLLYSGLESGTAGDVITSLDQQSAYYEVRGSAIYVETRLRDQLRMTLASAGLPANSAQGYELLDSLTGFGTTAQMFDAAYWRAKEGELARTILSSPHIRAARVHISTSTGRVFQRDQKTTAAVTVTTTGNTLSISQAKALRYLVASSVSGLSPDNVAVIDGEGGLIGGSDENNITQSSDSKAAELRERVTRILEARVGQGNAVVEVSIDTVTESESIIERRFDPEGRVAVSTESEEQTNTSNDSGGNAVTVASNLPDGDAGASGTSSNENSQTRQITNFEVSETQREIIRLPGAVRRLTVAVLVNSGTVTDPVTGEVSTQTRGEEEMAALKELTAAAVGFDETRGDVITLKSMDFEPVFVTGTEAQEPEVTRQPLDLMALSKLAILGVVALVLGLFVLRPILTSGRKAGTGLDISRPAAMNSAIDAVSSAPNKTEVQATLPTSSSLENLTSGTPVALAAPADEDNPEETVSRLRQMIEERQDETMQLLQNWMEDPQETEQV